jgi:hypothetical protein
LLQDHFAGPYFWVLFAVLLHCCWFGGDGRRTLLTADVLKLGDVGVCAGKDVDFPA